MMEGVTWETHQKSVPAKVKLLEIMASVSGILNWEFQDPNIPIRRTTLSTIGPERLSDIYRFFSERDCHTLKPPSSTNVSGHESESSISGKKRL